MTDCSQTERFVRRSSCAEGELFRSLFHYLSRFATSLSEAFTLLVHHVHPYPSGTHVDLLFNVLGYVLSLQVQNKVPHHKLTRNGFSWLNTTSLEWVASNHSRSCNDEFAAWCRGAGVNGGALDALAAIRQNAKHAKNRGEKQEDKVVKNMDE